MQPESRHGCVPVTWPQLTWRRAREPENVYTWVAAHHKHILRCYPGGEVVAVSTWDAQYCHDSCEANNKGLPHEDSYQTRQDPGRGLTAVLPVSIGFPWPVSPRGGYLTLSIMLGVVISKPETDMGHVLLDRGLVTGLLTGGLCRGRQ
jgi:hypothetical protein